jgi:hypothetical protein
VLCLSTIVKRLRFLDFEVLAPDTASGIFLYAIIVALFSWSLAWAFRDAKIRGRNPWLCILFISVAGWPFSVLWWRWLRPRKDNPESEIDHA